MTYHKNLEIKDDHGVNFDSESVVRLPHDYTENRDQYLNMLSEFQSTWNGHLCQMHIVKHRIGLTGENAQPVHNKLSSLPDETKSWRVLESRD